MAAETTQEGVSVEGTKAASLAPDFDTTGMRVFSKSGITSSLYFPQGIGKITDSGKITPFLCDLMLSVFSHQLRRIIFWRCLNPGKRDGKQ